MSRTLLLALLLPACSAATFEELHRFTPRFAPPPEAIKSIREFGAKGDGTSDDTAAFRAAIGKNEPRALYIPAGTYLVRDALVFGADDKEKKKVCLIGESRDTTVIKLADASPGYQDAKKPKFFLSTRHPKQQGEQNMFNYLYHLTLEVGKGNPGCIALNYHTNNSGCVKDVRIRASDPQGSPGLIGLSCGEWEVGPGSLRYLQIEGFATGISLTRIGNYITLEHALVRHCGTALETGTASVRGLVAEDCRLGVRATGQVVLLDSRIAGKGPAAVELVKKDKGQGQLLARRLATSGFEAAIRPAEGEAVRGPEVKEWLSAAPKACAPGAPVTTLDLPVEEAPELQYPERPEDWTLIRSEGDITAALQEAIDAGKKDIFIAGTKGVISGTVALRKDLRRLAGAGHAFIQFKSGEQPAFRLEDGSAPLVLVELIYGQYGGTKGAGRIEHASRRSLALRHGSLAYRSLPAAAGAKVFIESVVANPMQFEGVDAWVRDLNTEAGGKEPCVVNRGGRLWLLGQKTEDFATKLLTCAGGSTELLGGTFRCNWDKGDFARAGLSLDDPPPLFLVEDARAGLTFISWGPAIPYRHPVRELRGGQVRNLEREKDGGSALLWRSAE